MPNRHTRDELIRIAIDMVHIPNLEHHDMPNGTVQPDAYSIRWLQDILDFWYHMVPFSATVDKVTLNCTANSDTLILPEDFILDVKHGYIAQMLPDNIHSKKRRFRLPLQKFITKSLTYQGATNITAPNYYCIQGDTDPIAGSINNSKRQTMKVTPVPTISTNGELWYYKLPPILRAGDKPQFPNDYVCIEYIRIRALEWANIIDPGTAQKFCEKVVAGMRLAGLMNEPEDDEVNMDALEYRGNARDTVTSYSWMGPQ